MGDEVLISDDDRQRAVERLRHHTGEGRLTLDEFSERVETALRARVAADLEPLLRDLPAVAATPAVPAPVPTAATSGAARKERRARVVAIMSGEARTGRWRARRHTTALALWGNVKLDLRRAELSGNEVEIRCWAIMGSVDVIVPEGMPVDSSGFVLMGGRTDRIADVPALPGAPTIRVRGYGMWGGVSVRSRRHGQRSLKESVDDRVQEAIDAGGAVAGDAATALMPPRLGPPQGLPDRIHGPPGRRGQSGRDRSGRSGGRAPHRGTVSVLVTDLVGSTALAERLGDQHWLRILREHNAIVRHHIEHHGGTEVKQQGDGFLATFPSARDAVRAALAVRRSIEAYRSDHPDAPLEIRCGVHAGEVERDGDDIHGVNVSTAARLTALAAPDEVLVSGVVAELADSTSDLRFGPVQEVAVPGRSIPLRVHAVDL